jgi:hypothetical protein
VRYCSSSFFNVSRSLVTASAPLVDRKDQLAAGVVREDAHRVVYGLAGWQSHVVIQNAESIVHSELDLYSSHRRSGDPVTVDGID